MKQDREAMVQKFHEAFGAPVAGDMTVESLACRKMLIEEEIKELFEEIDAAITLLEAGKEVAKKDKAKLLKELADVQFVISGTAVELKPLARLDEALQRVLDSNMSKLGEDGKPILREDGKVLKGPHYTEPNLEDLV